MRSALLCLALLAASTSAADRRIVWKRCRITPGSTAPGRVPMQMPSSAVNPSVLSTLVRFLIAHRLAPLPRCATMTRPPAISGATSGRTDAMYSYDRPWNP